LINNEGCGIFRVEYVRFCFEGTSHLLFYISMLTVHSLRRAVQYRVVLHSEASGWPFISLNSRRSHAQNNRLPQHTLQATLDGSWVHMQECRQWPEWWGWNNRQL
jgi:hypothetical protein